MKQITLLLFLSAILLSSCIELAMARCGLGSLCDWTSWDSWSQCSRPCGGGTRSRTRALCCRNRWETSECLSECGLQNSGFTERGSCNTHCYNNGEFTGNGCSCPEAYYDSCCGSRINCGFPGNIANGMVHGTSYEFGDSVTYSCDNFYNLTGGDYMRTCGRLSPSSNLGVWSGSQPRCAYAHSCNSGPCQNDATCVNVLDGFLCDCDYGWGGNICQLDILPPYVDNCPPDPRHHLTDQLTKFVSWEEPRFSDHFGNDVTVTSNLLMATEADLSWGDNQILYTGRKENNALTTDCAIAEIVDPHPCDEPAVPVNGALVCTDWNSRFARVCANMCNEEWTVSRGRHLEQLMVCGATGTWSPDAGGYNCTKPRLPGKHLSHFPGECDMDSKVIKQNFLALLTLERSPFKMLCEEFREECSVENVIIRC